MPVLVAWIGEMLLSVVGQLALSALVSVGIGISAEAVGSGLIDSSSIRTAFGGAGDLIPWIGFCGVDQAITIVLSALAGRAIVNSARAHFVRKGATPSAS
jgi:hypothetical protein